MTLVSARPVPALEGRSATRRGPSDLWAGVGLLVLTLSGIAYVLHVQVALTGTLWGMPVDDAYIHFRFAQNLAAGHGFAFNPDQPVPGSTSPLWALLLAAAALCGVSLPLSAKVFGIAFLGLAALLTWRLARRIIPSPAAAWLTGVLTALDGRLLWAAPSGMEVTLFAALSLAVFTVQPDSPPKDKDVLRRVLLLALLCGLASLARPEGYLLTALAGANSIRRNRPSWMIIALGAMIYLALVAPYAIFSLLTTGHPLPTTFYAKSSVLDSGTITHALAYLFALCYLLVQGNVALLAAPLGAWLLWRKGGIARLLVAWPILLLLEQAVLSPVLYHFGRYVMPLQPFFALWAVAGVAPIAFRRRSRSATIPEVGSFHPTRRVPQTMPRQSIGLAVTTCRQDAGGPSTCGAWHSALLPLLLVLASLLTIGTWATRYAASVQNIDSMHVALGRWVRTHVPAGAPVALNDIGAISYVSGHPAIDIEGLVTPRFLALKREQPSSRRARDMIGAIQRRGAHYLIVFPSVYPWLVAQPGITPVCSVSLSHAVVVPSRLMTVYAVSPGHRATAGASPRSIPDCSPR